MLSRLQSALLVLIQVDKPGTSSSRCGFYRIKGLWRGEWKVRKHGIGKHRAWRKLHMMVDAQTRKVVAVQLTAKFVGDPEVLSDLLNQLD